MVFKASIAQGSLQANIRICLKILKDAFSWLQLLKPNFIHFFIAKH